MGVLGKGLDAACDDGFVPQDTLHAPRHGPLTDIARGIGAHPSPVQNICMQVGVALVFCHPADAVEPAAAVEKVHTLFRRVALAGTDCFFDASKHAIARVDSVPFQKCVSKI